MRKISDLFKLEKYKDVQPHHHHISMLLVGKILLIITVVILIKPALTGFTISSQFEEINLSASEVLNEQERIRTDNLLLRTKLDGCNENVEALENDISSEKNLKNECLEEKDQLESSCNENIKGLERDVVSEANLKNECLRDKSEAEFQLEQSKRDFENNLGITIKESEDEKQELTEQLNEEIAEGDKLEDDFKELAENSANNICCKLKVDDQSIDSYSVFGNRIICGSGEDIALSC